MGGDTYRNAWLSHARKAPDLAAGRDLDAYQAAITNSEERIANRLLPALLQRARLTVPETTCSTICGTTAVGFIAALHQAKEWLDKHACDRCIIGGLDSLIDPTTLEALNGLRMLKTPESPVGMIPGEGSCFLLIENPSAAAMRGAAIQAILQSPATAMGAAHPRLGDPVEGKSKDALAESLAKSFAALNDAGQATGLVVINLDGGAYRAAAWGDALIRVLTPMRLGLLTTWLPPLFFGETGAAAGPASVALLARGWARGYAPSANAVVCLLDDFGKRGTVYVRAKA